jgi:hypothetical protein
LPTLRVRDGSHLRNLSPWLGFVLLLGSATLQPLHGQRMTQSWKPAGYLHRAAGTGTASLRASAVEMLRTGSARHLNVRAVLRFMPGTDRWEPLAISLPLSIRVPVPPPRQIYSGDTDQILLVIPEPVGLFWVDWQEDGHRVTSFAYAGPMLCEDVMLGPAPAGRVAACVPFADRAEARFVPDPARR